MGKKERRPGDPYEVGFGKPPKRTRFKKGRSGNPKGRPPRKPDVYSELTKVLREKVTITVDGQPEKVTVQQALLLRLRDQALRGELWAEKLLQKVVAALPESGSEHDVDMRTSSGQVLRSCPVNRLTKNPMRRQTQRRPRMPSDDSPVGYKRPPVHSRFQKGQSGNPRGRPKKVPDFMEDAAEILGGTVTGQAKGKSITLPMVQAMFRTLCRQALKGDNQALRRVIELMLTLEPVARDKARQAEEKDKAMREVVRKFSGWPGSTPTK